MNEVNFITNKKNELIKPLIFLGFVLVVSLGLFLFNWRLDYTNSQLDQKISERESDIKILEADPKIQVYSLVEANKSTIVGLEKRSMITKYINHIKSISKKYDVNFEGFTISNGDINTVSLVSSTDKGLAYAKTRDFIKNYRLDDKALFNLEFVSSIEGGDSMKIPLIFKLK
ncbi:MAG: hypothetical protein PHV23_02060 [Candidatus Gracilibacteria bacterium]|nr:hypothetical protein [Candidatus Gracilibacteria bacterium]